MLFEYSTKAHIPWETQKSFLFFLGQKTLKDKDIMQIWSMRLTSERKSELN